MSIICWGNLAKSADDTLRIEQSIQDYVESHDENPNAHMGPDYALGAHRLQEALDHPYGSIRYWHVYDIHAEKITAGAMVIRGDGPYIVVQDQTYAERVRIYPEGIIVKGGKISVENEGSQQIIDGKGLMGSNVFYSSDKSLLSETTIPGSNKWYFFSPLVFGVYVARATPIMVFGNISYWVNREENCLHMTIQHNAVYNPALMGWSFLCPVGSTRIQGVFSFNRILQLYAGANLIRPVFNIDSAASFGGGISTGDELSNFGYVVLGN